MYDLTDNLIGGIVAADRDPTELSSYRLPT